MNALSDSPRLRSLLALILLVPAPMIGVCCAMWLLKENPVGNAVWGFSKIWILGLPLVWLLFVDRGWTSFSLLKRERLASGLIAGMATGFVILVLILLGYYWFGQHWIDTDQVRDHLIAVGLNSKWKYLAMCVFWIVVNSALEEYVWRWFVYTRCRALLPAAGAVVLSGLAFTLHHVFALGFNFQWDARVVALASLGVFVGGVTWSILYAAYRSVWVGWISHVWADIAVFYIGYQLLFAG